MASALLLAACLAGLQTRDPSSFPAPLPVALDQEGKAQDDPPTAGAYRPEEFKILRTKTGWTLPAGQFQLDAVASALAIDQELQGGGLPERSPLSLLFEATYGITHWLTGEFTLPVLSVDQGNGEVKSGLGDVAVELKGHFPRSWVPFDLAAGLRVAFPTGDEESGLGRGTTDWKGFAAASQPLLDWLSIHGEAFIEAARGHRVGRGLNIAADTTPWDPDVSLLLGLETSRDAGRSPSVQLTPGVEFRIRPRLVVVGIGVPIGLSNQSADWGLIVNLRVGF
jgi:hypothetical protein